MNDVLGTGFIGPRFSTSTRSCGVWSGARPCRLLSPGDETPLPHIHWKGAWVDARVGLDDMKGSIIRDARGSNLEPPGGSTRRQSLYRKRYRGFQ
jgi:hypothetical protein